MPIVAAVRQKERRSLLVGIPSQRLGTRQCHPLLFFGQIGEFY